MSEQYNTGPGSSHTGKQDDRDTSSQGTAYGSENVSDLGRDTRTSEGGDSSSVTHLARQLVHDVTVLVRKELALASSEVKQSVNDAKQGAVSLASGGGVLYAGLLFLLLAAMLGLAEVMPAWLAALIVGGVVVIIGLVMVKSGSSKLQPSSFSPDRTAESMRKDKEMVARQTS